MLAKNNIIEAMHLSAQESVSRDSEYMTTPDYRLKTTENYIKVLLATIGRHNAQAREAVREKFRQRRRIIKEFFPRRRGDGIKTQGPSTDYILLYG